MGPASTKSRVHRLRSALPWITAGQLDAGFASLASFASGLFAVRRLSAAGLGAYGLLFAAFMVVNQFPAQLIFGPAEVLSVRKAADRRLGTLAWSLKFGAVVAVITAGGIWLGALPLFGDVVTDTLVPLTTTATLLAVVSPIQDHMRRVFHLAGSSWRAAQMSLIHLVSVGAGLVAIGAWDEAWAPFGALLFGNVVSIGVGLLWVARRHVESWTRPPTAQLRGIGGWLLLVGLASTGFGYAVFAVLKAIAGTEAVGFVEGSRVIAQPLNVVALGLVAVTAPRSMESASRGLVGAAKSWRLRFVLLFAAVAVPYGVFVGLDSAVNPLPQLLPNAYMVSGLVPAMIAATLAHSIASPWRAELMGAQLQASLGRTVMTSGMVDVVTVSATAGFIGVFSVPLGLAAGAMVRLAGFAVRLKRWYAAFGAPEHRPDSSIHAPINPPDSGRAG